jgi:hypothetical protein
VNAVDLSLGESSASLQLYLIQPKLADFVVAFHANVRWIISVACKEKGSVRANAKSCQHLLKPLGRFT